ncbi:MAG: hypothetical protein FJ100_18225 [Deltaproteobacteria bacterium]|nr:hypothetical protein [Deltaproteobacteria bacterium]
MRLHDGRTWLRLTDEIGRGGEGTVLAVEGDADRVAKVYASAPDAERCEKLRCMVALLQQAPGLGAHCAWPERLLTDDNGQLRGFLMRRLHDQHPVHALYSPEERKRTYPKATWETLARAAAGCARMFAALHSHGVLVGDVNERNVLVAGDGSLQLVDCDSFQITFEGRTYLTGVGVVDYTPPELQGADFRSVVRTENHDLFGLAVLVFKLVFMGRHPFSGGATGDMAAAIAACHYDYPDVAQRLKHLLPLAAVPGSLRAMFEYAFGDPEETGERPAAQVWAAELDDMAMALQPCATDSMHRVPQSLSRCPWCLIEATLHYAYFLREDGDRYVSTWSPRAEELHQLRLAMARTDGPPEPSSLVAPDEVDRALQMARRVANLGPPAHLDSWHVRVVGTLAVLGATAQWSLGHGHLTAALAVAGAALWAMGGAWAWWARRPWIERLDAMTHLHHAVLAGADAWQAEAHQRRMRDRQLIDTFDVLCDRHEAIVRHRLGQWDRLSADAIDESTRPQLGAIGVEEAELPAAIGTDRRRTLLVRGLATAADIERHRLVGLPGLTGQVIDALVQWRQGLETQLGGRRRPQPKPDQFAAIDQNCTVMQTEIEDQLAAVIAERHAAANAARDALDAIYAAYADNTEMLAREGERLWLALRR